MAKEKAKFLIVAAPRLVGIMTELSATIVDYTLVGLGPPLPVAAESTVTYPFTGFASRGPIAPGGAEFWTVRIALRSCPWNGREDMSCRFPIDKNRGTISKTLRSFPSSIVAVVLADLTAFRLLCERSGIAVEVREYETEIAISPLPNKSVAA